jgi:hypothetical protein
VYRKGVNQNIWGISTKCADCRKWTSDELIQKCAKNSYLNLKTIAQIYIKLLLLLLLLLLLYYFSFFQRTAYQRTDPTYLLSFIGKTAGQKRTLNIKKYVI